MKKILILFVLIFTLTFSNALAGDNCLDLTSDLRQGYRDSVNIKNIYNLQAYLKSKGYLNSNPTGFFGSLTLKAVKNFQKDNAIRNTGLVGPLTRDFIKKQTCVNQNPVIETPSENQNTNTENTTTTNVPTSETVTPNPTTPVTPDEVLISSNTASIKVRTDGVVSIYNNSVVVRGVITQGARNGVERWFEITKNGNEYKKSETITTAKVGQRTDNQKFEDTFTNLESQTNYYFRACAGNTSLNQRACGGTTTVKTN